MIILERIFYFIVVLGSLVFVHELGHFLAAKLFGIRVEVFSLGFGPRIAGFRKGETDYRVAVIPLGGYVKMAGEYDHREDVAPDPAYLTSKPRWQRLIVAAAGPAMNVAMAVGIWWVLFMAGTEVMEIPEGPPVVEAVAAGSPAEQAGIRHGDQIVAIDETPITSIEDYGRERIFHPDQVATYTLLRGDERLTTDVRLGKHPLYGVGTDGVSVSLHLLLRSVDPGGPGYEGGLRDGDIVVEVDGRLMSSITGLVEHIQARPDQGIAFVVERDGARRALTVTPARSEDGKGRIGVTISYPTRLVRLAPAPAFSQAIAETGKNVALLFRTLSALFKREVGVDVVSGPLEIARISQDQARGGLASFLHLIAFISINLGVFNLLPVPILDGGVILVLLVESAIRRDIPPMIKERILQVGFIMLIVLAAVVITMDVRKAIRASSLADKPPAVEAPAEPSAP